MQSEIRESDEDRFPRRERFVDLHRRGELGEPDEVAGRMRKAVRGLATGDVVDLRDLDV